MYSSQDDSAAREASLGAGYAYAAGGRRMMDSEIGLNKGTRYNSTQRFEDFAGELPGRGEIERWGRSTKSFMTNDQKAVLRGSVPAKLMLDTEPFDYTGLPDLPAMATDVQKNNRAFEIAKYDNSNAARLKYRAARIVEVKSELGDDIALALEARAQLLLKKL